MQTLYEFSYVPLSTQYLDSLENKSPERLQKISDSLTKNTKLFRGVKAKGGAWNNYNRNITVGNIEADMIRRTAGDNQIKPLESSLRTGKGFTGNSQMYDEAKDVRAKDRWDRVSPLPPKPQPQSSPQDIPNPKYIKKSPFWNKKKAALLGLGAIGLGVGTKMYLDNRRSNQRSNQRKSST